MEESIQNLNYCKVESYENVPIIKIKEVEEFIKLINKFNPLLIYVSNNQATEAKEDTEFSFYHQGVLYLIKGWNYKTLADLCKGKSKGFNSGEIYYQAKEKGFVDYQEYELYQNLDYDNKEDYLHSAELGFRNCLEKYNNIHVQKYEDKYVAPPNFTKEKDIYYYALENDFKDFPELLAAISIGFDEGKTYREAIEKNFIHKIQYVDAIKKGFTSPQAYEEAKSFNIKTYEDYKVYKYYKDIQKKYFFSSIEEAHFYDFLKNLDTRRKVSLSDLWEKFKKEKDKYSYMNNLNQIKRLAWYSQKFNQKEDLELFLLENLNVHKVGKYFKDEKIFLRTSNLENFNNQVGIDGSQMLLGMLNSN